MTQASPESQGISEEKLRSAIAYMDEKFAPEGARELVILRNGRVVWAGADVDSYHEMYSVTKVFTTTALGLLIDDGRCSLDTRAVEYLPHLADQYPAYAQVTLRHLATMTGGYHGELGSIQGVQIWGDPIIYTTLPDAPEFEPAGSHVAYNDHDTHLLARIMTRIAREPLKGLLKRRITDPIGLTRWDWGVSGTVDGMIHYNAAGTPALHGNGGIQTTSMQLSFFGLLYLNRGRWNDKQLLSASFVEEATSNQVPPGLPGRSSRWLSGGYGFYWWTNGVMSNGRRRLPAAPKGAFCASGADTNYCFAIPEWNMVITRTGESGVSLPGTDAEQWQLWDRFLARIANAMEA